ncbi:MAG: DNA-processing protein DprA [Clostridia bacterium]|nr:DNA-processing protein DprA [Clostridia bacterium]
MYTYTEIEQYWIWLTCVEGIGAKRFYQLLTIFGDPRTVWDNVDAPEMRFLGQRTWANLRKARSPEMLGPLFEHLEKTGCRAIPRISDAYPPLLNEIYDPPATLFQRGVCPLDDPRMFAIVGSRRCTRDGSRAGRDIAEQLALEGVTVVSGMARGIDTSAHQGAISGGGRTIAVLGCGTNIIYPPENDRLALEILEGGGCLLSEYPPDTQPLAGHFPARNRIISGLCKGVLLIEGAKGSGAMITIRQAADQSRDVFAVPGSIYSSLSAMPNQLIVEGAFPVLSAWDILEHYRWAERPSEKPSARLVPDLDENEKKIVDQIRNETMSFEELSERTEIPPPQLNSYLTILELRGIIVKVPGGMYRAYQDTI